MTSRTVWLLLVSLVLMCCMIGCGEKPEPVVEKPKAVVSEAEESKAAMEKAVARQKECSQSLGIPVEIRNSIGMKLRLIPAGEFMMGTLGILAEPVLEVKPVHKVTITKPFYIGVCEVTQAEYEKVMGTNPSCFAKGELYADRVSGKDTSRHPVESVSWTDAVEFCKKLSAKEGKTYRLPTEAEWEYACRAGTKTFYYWGDAFDREYAWVRPNSEGTTHDVGTRKPNAWGLYDMAGNVKEWCGDWSGEYSSEEQVDPQGPPDGSSRIVRDGYYDHQPYICRSDCRAELPPDHHVGSTGFRIVRNQD